MSTTTPFVSRLPTKPLKFVAPLRGEKVDAVPAGADYLGLEQMESWTGRLSSVELQQHPEAGANTFHEGDVLFGKLRPYLAKGWDADRSGFCTTESLVLRPLESDSRFVRYCLLTPEFVEAVNGSTYGSKMPRADWSFIGNVQVPCPSTSVQARIANFLDEQTARIDALIAEKEALLGRLSSSREAYAFALATQGKAAKGFVVRDEPWLPSVPGHWSVPKLGYIAEVGNGSTPRREVPEYWLDGTIPWVTSTAIHGGIIERTEEHITERALEECHLRIVRAGSTIVGLIGQGPTRGMAARLTIPATLSQNVAFVSARAGSRVSDEYLTVVLTGLYSAMRFLSDGVGGAHGAMNCDQLRALRVPLPPPTEQVAIVSEFRKREAALEALTTHAAAHIDRLREYRSSLVSAAVTGQLDIGAYKEAA